MTRASAPRPAVLTIAGSDSGGGAGIQADLRVFHRHGVFGTCALTAVTAQNLAGVRHVAGLGGEDVRQQIEAVVEGFDLAAAKTGMLWSAEIVAAVARATELPGFPARLVVDPVMVATSGDALLQRDAVQAYREALLPRCTVVTPNLDEAALLLGRRPAEAGEMEHAARELGERLGCSVLLKGGHLARGEQIVDLLWWRERGRSVRWRHPRVGRVTPHGTGCSLAAAVAAQLALGRELDAACGAAVAFVAGALQRPLALAGGIALPDLEGAPISA